MPSIAAFLVPGHTWGPQAVWLLVITHEPETPSVRVRPDGREWFLLVPE